LEWIPESGGAMGVRDFELLTSFGVRSVLAVPVPAETADRTAAEGGRLHGVFCLLNFGRPGTAEESTLAMLTSFTEQIRLVLDNELTLREFTDRYLATARAISRAYDARSPYTRGHSERVARVGAAIARQLGLSEPRVAHVHEAGLVHDAGMCGVVEISDSFQADFDHPAIGASMLEILSIPAEIADAVRTHHEWYNGWGFPDGRQGEEIPLAGQILAVAEYVVESEAGNRVRPPLSREEVIQEVRSRRGVQFAPSVVDALLALSPDQLR
jgi:HD-GYP domain-containing protein (c-di-GMP phosphodiesterase class II)